MSTPWNSRSRIQKPIEQDVPKDKTEAYQEYFTFSDPAGWRFYLPAFMSHYLSEFPDYGYDAVYWPAPARTF